MLGCWSEMGLLFRFSSWAVIKTEEIDELWIWGGWLR